MDQISLGNIITIALVLVSWYSQSQVVKSQVGDLKQRVRRMEDRLMSGGNYGARRNDEEET